MGEKQRLRSILKILYIVYATFLISNLKIISNKSSLVNNNYLINILDHIKIGIDSPGGFFMFQMVFISIFYYALKSSSNKIIVFEDAQKKYKLRKKLISHKIFVFINILLAIYTITLSQELNSAMSSIELVLMSILIFYGKKIYIKSYLFDRKIKWLESINSEKYDEINVDTIKWRYKIWVNKKEKIKFQYRKIHIILDVVHILFLGYIFIFSDTILFKLIWGYFLICGGLNLIENIFGLYTSIDGICTGVYETTDENRSKNYYNIVVTDYNKKQEIEFKIHENYSIQEMDNLNLVHGILTKKVLFMNNINVNKVNTGNILYYLVFMFILIYPNIDYINYYLTGNFKESQYIEETLSYDDEQKKNNIIEKLPEDEAQYTKIINVNKEASFNNVTINVKKILLGKIGSKVCFDIINNSDKGMVLNVDYKTHIKDKESGENSNILLPKKEYSIEMDILEPYNKEKVKIVEINLEYTLSETIKFDNEYMDYSYYRYYLLNVVDNNCNISINLKNGDTNIKFDEYDQFYNKTDEIVTFK